MYCRNKLSSRILANKSALLSDEKCYVKLALTSQKKSPLTTDDVMRHFPINYSGRYRGPIFRRKKNTSPKNLSTKWENFRAESDRPGKTSREIFPRNPSYFGELYTPFGSCVFAVFPRFSLIQIRGDVRVSRDGLFASVPRTSTVAAETGWKRFFRRRWVVFRVLRIAFTFLRVVFVAFTMRKIRAAKPSRVTMPLSLLHA